MKLKVETRDVVGKNVKKIRREGKIPAVIYGKHLESPISITCDRNDFVRLYKKTGSSTPIILSGEGLDEMVLVHDYQLEPVMDEVLHVDFLGIKKGEKVSAELSIVIVGEEDCQLVKSGTASIQLVKDFIDIEALPKDLVKEITIDVSSIDDLSTTIFVKDLDIPNGVEVKDDLEQVVVTVSELKDIPEEVEEVVESATWNETEETPENTEETKEGE